MPSRCPSICDNKTVNESSELRLPLMASMNSTISINPELSTSTLLNAFKISSWPPFNPRNSHDLTNSGDSSRPDPSLSNFLKVSLRSLLICSSVKRSRGSCPMMPIILFMILLNLAPDSSFIVLSLARSSALFSARCLFMLAFSSREDCKPERTSAASFMTVCKVSSCARGPKLRAISPINEKANSLHSIKPDPSTSTLSQTSLISVSLPPRPRNFQASTYSSNPSWRLPSLSNALNVSLSVLYNFSCSGSFAGGSFFTSPQSLLIIISAILARSSSYCFFIKRRRCMVARKFSYWLSMLFNWTPIFERTLPKLSSAIRDPLMAVMNSLMSIKPDLLVSTSLNASLISDSDPFKPRKNHACWNSHEPSSPLLSSSNFWNASFKWLLISSSERTSSGLMPIICAIKSLTAPETSPFMFSSLPRSSPFFLARISLFVRTPARVSCTIA